MKDKPIVLNGVGKAFINSVVNGKKRRVPLGTLQDMKLTFSGSSEKVYGGDTMSPIAIIDKDQDITAAFTEARFGLSYLNLVRGADLSDSGKCVFDVGPDLVASGTSYTVPGNLTDINPESVSVVISDDADGFDNVKVLNYKATEPGDGEFTITTAGVVTLGAAVTNKYISVSGLYTNAEASSAVITSASLPDYVEIHHKSMPMKQDDGSKVIFHTVIYKARSTGQLTVDFKRQAAATPELEFDVIDPHRRDGAIITVTRETVA